MKAVPLLFLFVLFSCGDDGRVKRVQPGERLEKLQRIESIEAQGKWLGGPKRIDGSY